MIKEMIFIEDFRCFKKDLKIDFSPGVNILVGDQGSGKSSLLYLLQLKNQKIILMHTEGSCKYLSFDSEKQNPRVTSHFTNPLELSMRFKSHGEFSIKFIETMLTQDTNIFLVDEIDTSLSIKSCFILVKILKKLEKSGIQIIASIHNPIVILSFDNVYSLDNKSWISSEKYVSNLLSKNKKLIKKLHSL